MAAPATLDRTTQDVGNIISLEHINVTIPDQALATLFYVVGMGFTRDPFMTVGLDNMWINIGAQQCHLPTRPEAQVLRGHMGIVVPSAAILRQRLEAAAPQLDGTRFSMRQEGNHLDVTCPWGNLYRCYEPAERFGRMTLGMPYVEFTVPTGTADGIARFYDQVLGSRTEVSDDPDGRAAHVQTGQHQEMIFRETDGPIPSYDGHHIAIYVANFSGPHAFFQEHGLLTEDDRTDQIRFQKIVDPDTGKELFEIEHEVRSLFHPGYNRPLVNRDPNRMW
jgi:hypothetical protein